MIKRESTRARRTDAVQHAPTVRRLPDRPDMSDPHVQNNITNATRSQYYRVQRTYTIDIEQEKKGEKKQAMLCTNVPFH